MYTLLFFSLHRQRARYGLFKYGPAEIMGKEGGHRPHPWATLAIVFDVLHGNGLTLIKLQQQRECIDWEFQMQLEYLLLLNGRDLWRILFYQPLYHVYLTVFSENSLLTCINYMSPCITQRSTYCTENRGLSWLAVIASHCIHLDPEWFCQAKCTRNNYSLTPKAQKKQKQQQPHTKQTESQLEVLVWFSLYWGLPNCKKLSGGSSIDWIILLLHFVPSVKPKNLSLNWVQPF